MYWRRIRELAASEAGGCAPLPTELAQGCLGFIVLTALGMAAGGFLMWCLSSPVPAAVAHLAVNVIWWIDGAGSPPP